MSTEEKRADHFLIELLATLDKRDEELLERLRKLNDPAAEKAIDWLTREMAHRREERLRIAFAND